MKKALVMGMVLVSMGTAQLSLAAGPAKAPREVMVEYVKKSQEAFFGKGGSAQKVSEATLNQAKKSLIRELDVPGLKGTQAMRSMMTSLSGEAGKNRMDALVTIVAVKKLKSTLEATDAAEAASIDRAANAMAKMISDSYLVGAKTEIATLKAEEVTVVRESLAKLEKLPADIIMQFSKAERDSFSTIMEKYNELKDSSNGTKSVEELFVDAIVEVKKETREQAMERVRKLKDCV